MSNTIKVVNGVTFYNGEVVTGTKREAALSFSRANAINSLNRTTSGNGRQYRIRQINSYNKELGLPLLDHTALDPSYQATVLTGNPKIDSPNGVDMRQRGDGTYYVPTSAIEAGENEILTSPTETTTNTVEEETKEETSDIITSSETAASNEESTAVTEENSSVEENPTENLTDKQKEAINPPEPEPESETDTTQPVTPPETEPVAEETPPPEEKKEADTKPYVPPVIIQHPEDGTFFMGRERDDKVTRKRDIQLVGSQSNSLRLFHDGGFELKSSEDAGGTSGSSILQVVDDAPLLIKSKGDIRIQCDGRFSVVAHDIKMKAEGADDTGGITLKSEHDITLDAANRAIIKGENVVLDAKDKVISYSEGWTFLVGQVVRIHEPKSQLIPDMLGKYIHTQTQPLKTN